MGKGAVGVALLHIERAATGLGGGEVSHTWLAAADGDTCAGAQATLFFGAPALAFALHAAADRPGLYERALESLDIRIAASPGAVSIRRTRVLTAGRSSILSMG